MKRKDFTDLKTKDTKALKKLVSDKKLEIAKKQMEVFSGKEKNLKLVTNLRREIAKILTLIREKEIVEKLNMKGESKGL
jgi:ribosomal protein L29